MSQKSQSWITDNSGDLAMMYMVIVGGLNFVVLRDAVSNFSPLAFNAIRFSLASLVVMLPLLIRRLPHMRIARRDLIRFMIATAIGLTFLQLMLVTSVKYTTAANASLMIATGPAWTVMLTVILGQLQLNRYLVAGLAIMFAGTSMIILAGGDGLQFSSDDLLGCALMLMGAAAAAAYSVAIQPLLERNNPLDMGLVKHATLSFSIVVIALPELYHLQPTDISMDILPNILFGGLIASVSGTMATTFAQRKIGATRMKIYDNIMPISATVFAFFLLGEPVTMLQVIGGIFTLSGVMTVRHFARAGVVTHRPVLKLAPAR